MRQSQPVPARSAIAGVLLLCLQGLQTASAHELSCDKRSGIDRARCERHQRMYAACGAIKGDAHVACDRSFLLANPLDCSALSGDDNKSCLTERTAAKSCEPQPGSGFMRCLREAGATDVMGKAEKPAK